jgi:Fur family transcriptional regulator, ferric uptake regulator
MTRVVPGTTRNTRQRTEVLALLVEVDGFRSAQQLHAELRSGGSKVGLTTVYRTLQLLADAGEVDQMWVPDGECLYRRCIQREHHHHLLCRSCGRTVELVDPEVSRWVDQQAAKHGYTDAEHVLEVFGTCATCRAGREAEVAAPGEARQTA